MVAIIPEACLLSGSCPSGEHLPSRDGELYFGIDGGSGFDCHLPYFSGYVLEAPSKMLQDHHTLPFKVMNGLVHGDSRSHVLLSSGSVVAVPH